MGLFELSEEYYITMYNIALQRCAIGNYASAIKILRGLILIANDNQLKYTKTLAMCLHHNSEFAAAAIFYLQVYDEDAATNADCLLYTAECLIQLNELQEAVEYLNLFMNNHSANYLDNPILVKVKMLHKIINKKLEDKA